MEPRNWKRYHPPADLTKILEKNPDVTLISTSDELLELACGGPSNKVFDVVYQIPRVGKVVDASVVRVRNGIAVNYPSPYMRRRDPDAMLIGDDGPTDRFIHNRDLDWLLSADVVVAEVTTVSMGVGYEIGRAVAAGKKVLCLFRPDSGRNLSAMITGCPELEVIKYGNFGEAKNAISVFFEKSK